jgi:hypothetical protein
MSVTFFKIFFISGISVEAGAAGPGSGSAKLFRRLERMAPLQSSNVLLLSHFLNLACKETKNRAGSENSNPDLLYCTVLYYTEVSQD